VALTERISGGNSWLSVLLPVVVVLLVLYATRTDASEARLQFIFHPSVPTQSLTQTQARQIFTARQQHWEDGSKIHVFVLNTDTLEHQRFCRQLLQMFPYQLERIWNQITYSGQGDPPHIVDSSQALINAVNQTPGAVGYATDTFLEDQQDNKVNPL